MSSSSSLDASSSTPSTSSPSSKHRRSLAISNNALNLKSDSRKVQALLHEREAKIASLQMQVTSLTNKLVTLNRHYKATKKQQLQQQQQFKNKQQNQHYFDYQNDNGHAATTPKRKHRLSPYGNVVQEFENSSNGKSKLNNGKSQLNNGSGGSTNSSSSGGIGGDHPMLSLSHERSRMGRNASIATAKELSNLDCPKSKQRQMTNQYTVERILQMFRDPSNHIDYLNSVDFANDLLKVNSKIRIILEREPRVAFLQSPVYVFGDIHGNLEDLHFFSDNIWRLGMSLTAGNFLFLGDYVDRGMNCLECIAYLFSMKLLLPQKVFLLRGNHETRDVNGWEEHYGMRSFLYQCRDRFGDELGYKVWEQINSTFDRMPLASVIDQDIFCVHGGIPRPITQMEDGSIGSRIQDILNVTRVAGINPPYEHEDELYQQVASDCIWSDPASDEQERNGVDSESGYGESARGGGAICFGHKAVKEFLDQHNFSYIMRAHEAHADGVAVSKGGKVFTIFSTSKDHNQGNKAMAGCILVDFENLQVINRSHAYRNVYIHRRDSLSIAKLSQSEIEERIRLGLVTDHQNDDDEEEDGDGDGDDDDIEYEGEDDDKPWEDMSDDDVDDDGEYIYDDREAEFKFSSRRSSVIPENTMASPQGLSSSTSSSSNDHTSNDENRWAFDFSNVETGNRKKKKECPRFSSIATIAEDTDEDKDAAMDFDEEKKSYSGVQYTY